jgi:subtilisin family serine protease
MAKKQRRQKKSPRGRHPYALAKFSLPPGWQPSVVVELRYEAPVAMGQGKFVGKESGREAADRLNAALDGLQVAEVRPSFAIKPRMLGKIMSIASALPKEPKAAAVEKRIEDADASISSDVFFKGNFARVILKSSAKAREVAARLKRYDAVWDAYVAPVPQPPVYLQPPDIAGTGSPFNIEPTQGYLYSAPDGVGACDVWDQPGVQGQGVTICDIEGGWNLAHEDLPPSVKVLGGTMLADPTWVNHGTAVLGEMVSVANGRGCVGIAHRAKAAVQSAFIDGQFDAAKAIDNAASKLKAGDILLIELHSELTVGKGDFVAMQYFSDVFTAIQAAVNKGIVIVEAAGNGNQNFDAAKFNGTGLQKDWGAIVVGAGVPPSNRIDFKGFGSGFPAYSSLGAPRSRIFFSNYGKIVNVQGWGWHVSTTGYGDAGGAGPNEHYTFRFSGTSSASPIVTAAAAILQGAAIKKNGAPLTPAKVRQILVSTGTPQAASPSVPVASNHIGPQPDVLAALKKL